MSSESSSTKRGDNNFYLQMSGSVSAENREVRPVALMPHCRELWKIDHLHSMKLLHCTMTPLHPQVSQRACVESVGPFFSLWRNSLFCTAASSYSSKRCLVFEILRDAALALLPDSKVRMMEQSQRSRRMVPPSSCKWIIRVSQKSSLQVADTSLIRLPYGRAWASIGLKFVAVTNKQSGSRQVTIPPKGWKY